MRKLSVGRLATRAVRWYARATPKELADGASWYRDARAQIRALAACYDVSLECAAGLVAVLSPMVRWEQNIVEAERILQQWRDGSEPTQAGHTAFPANVRKAWDIAYGIDPERILRGRKVVSFYLTLVDKPAEPVIDSIIINALVNGDPTPFTTSADAKASFDRPRELAAISQALVTAAGALRIPPHVLQATVWLVYRNMRDAL